MNKNKLPQRLKYLECIRKELSKIPPEELNEMTDTNTLVEALTKRIKGLSNEEADELLLKDTELLANWLEDKRDSEAACHYMYGFLLGTNAEALRSESESEPETGYVHAQFPEGFQAKRANVCLNGLNRNIIIAVIPWVQDVYENNKSLFFDGPSIVNAFGNIIGGTKADFNYEFSSIISGTVKGHKRTYIQKTPVFVKSVQYLLEVPGGHVSVMISNKDGKDFDEIILEPFLKTIEIKPEP